MRFDWPDDLVAFRREVQDFAADHGRGTGWHDDHDEAALAERSRTNLAALDQRGWLKQSWPEELGGAGKSPWYQYLLALELGYRGVDYGRGGTASMIGPAIQKFGTASQQSELLEKIWSGEITCALGYSEPDAGSDLASLRTRAVRDGDTYVITGSKIWTSDAHRTTHVWLACRTNPDAPKHRGISIFLVPLDRPGITIRPIWVMFGHRTNEVFLDEVRVPVDARVGEEDRGWYIMANALDHERITMAANNYIDLVHTFEWSIEHLRRERPDVLADPVARAKLAELKIDLHMMRALLVCSGNVIARGEIPTKEGSMGKVWATELGCRLAQTVLDLLGPAGVQVGGSVEPAPVDGKLEHQLWISALQRFTGGANEIQRTIIAERGLGLPRG